MSKLFKEILEKIPGYKRRMIGISVDIGAQIHEYLKEAGMNQRQLADKMGKKESEISKWVNGSHNFTIETVAKIEEVFDKKIILVPMFATQDLGFKYEFVVKEKDDKLGWNRQSLWGVTKSEVSSVISNKNNQKLNTVTSMQDTYKKRA